AETVSLGAAYAAGLAVGYWPDLEGLRRNWHLAARWTPQMDPSDRESEYANWKRAVERTFGWARPKRTATSRRPQRTTRSVAAGVTLDPGPGMAGCLLRWVEG